MSLSNDILDSSFTEGFINWLFLGLLFVGIPLMLIGFVLMVLEDATSPNIALRKSEWKCARTETRTYTQSVIVGKAILPQTVTNEVCVSYERR